MERNIDIHEKYNNIHETIKEENAGLNYRIWLNVQNVDLNVQSADLKYHIPLNIQNIDLNDYILLQEKNCHWVESVGLAKSVGSQNPLPLSTIFDEFGCHANDYFKM